MPTVAIICEYNPFHNGHLYHINKIREEFGQDTTIVAIMSGNFTQRGEFAIADKAVRSKCAVDSGVNLCLEIPFPFSMSSAEFYARSAVSIANSLGTIDYLSFGSECGDINMLEKTASLMLSPEYLSKLEDNKKNPSYKKLGYPELSEKTLMEIAGDKILLSVSEPNNILAIEYIKAIKLLQSKIVPHTIKRKFADYNNNQIVEGQIQSASAIRRILLDQHSSALEYIPETAKKHILSAIKNSQMPCNETSLSSAVISHFRLNHPCGNTDIHDAQGGLYNRLETASFKANDIDMLIRLSETKKYTTARIRRAIWYSYFGVTSSRINSPPLFSQVLAMDKLGRAELRKIKSALARDFVIITKPSDYDRLTPEVMEQKMFSDRADSIYQLTKPSFCDGNYSLLFTPYVKSDE